MSTRVERMPPEPVAHRPYTFRLLLGGALVGLFLMPPHLACAGEADVVRAKAVCDAKSVCRFTVTVRHDDKGWNHYADAYEVLNEEGTVLAKRVLRHPHVDEQPFTRPFAGVELPPELESVRIRAHDSQHGHGGKEVTVKLVRP